MRVRVPQGSGYQLTAHTSFGKIRSDFPLTVSGSLSQDSITGTIGSGQCEMRLTNSNGAIEILNSGAK